MLFLFPILVWTADNKRANINEQYIEQPSFNIKFGERCPLIYYDCVTSKSTFVTYDASDQDVNVKAV